MNEYIYAIINDDNIVENIVVSDSPDSLQALSLMLPEAKNIVLTTEETKPAYIGGDIFDNKFRMPSPFPSWIWNSESWKWDSPVPYPEGGNGYVWNEETISWIEIPSTAISD